MTRKEKLVRRLLLGTLVSAALLPVGASQGAVFVHGRPVANVEALANPESLDLFRDLDELRR